MNRNNKYIELDNPPAKPMTKEQGKYAARRLSALFGHRISDAEARRCLPDFELWEDDDALDIASLVPHRTRGQE